MDRRASLRRDVPDACTVEVHLEAMVVDEVRDANDLGLRDDCTVEGILDFDYLRWGAELV